MTGYQEPDDPYCYAGTSVLKNRAGLNDPLKLAALEEAIVAIQIAAGLPTGRWSVRHYQQVHRHLFGEVYGWAGKFRTVRIAKDGSVFCYPEHISGQIAKLFARMQAMNWLRGADHSEASKRLATFLGELNAIHPFREGNGRTQLAFAAMLADAAGFHLALERLNPQHFLQAMIQSFNGSADLLEQEITLMMK